MQQSAFHHHAVEDGKYGAHWLDHASECPQPACKGEPPTPWAILAAQSTPQAGNPAPVIRKVPSRPAEVAKVGSVDLSLRSGGAGRTSFKFAERRLFEFLVGWNLISASTH